MRESIRLNGQDAQDERVNVDTTVQEKNITFPTDAKLHKKIIERCQAIAKKEGIKVRQSYKRTLKVLAREQRFRNHPKNKLKAKRADKKMKTFRRLVGKLPKQVKVDRGYKGHDKIEGTQVLIPSTATQSKTYYQKQKLSHAHNKRAGIEPVIGHIKTDHRLVKNFYKGVIGDSINIMLAAAAFNFKRVMNRYKTFFLLFWQKIFYAFYRFQKNFLTQNNLKMTF